MTFEEAWAPVAALSASPREKLERLWQEAVDVIARGVHGDFAEFGVWRGASAWILANACRGTGRRLHLYDTFTGIPASAVTVHDSHPAGDFADTNLDQVKRLLSEFGGAIRFQVGEFAPETVPDNPLALVHIDCDVYHSYELALPRFWSILSPGGLLVLDDYGVPTCPGATLATEEWLMRADPIPDQVLAFPGPAGNWGAIIRRAL